MSKISNFIRPIIAFSLFSLLIFAIISSVNKKPPTIEKIWYKSMTLGNPNAKNHYVLYTDLACPYCNVIAHHLYKNAAEFNSEYLTKKDILYEVRITDFLYANSPKRPYASRQAAKGSLCAAKEDKFWNFYHATLDAFWRDFQSKGIAVSSSSQPLPELPDNYWLNIAQAASLSENFKSCYNSQEIIQEVERNTTRASEIMNSISSPGLPFLQLNDNIYNGIPAGTDFTNGWGNIKLLLDSGLKKS